METLKNCIFTSKGRLNRLKYVKFSLALSFVYFLLLFAVIFAFSPNPKFSMFGIGIVESLFLLVIPMAIGQIMLLIRRFHDLNHTGWFTLLYLIAMGIGKNFEFGWVISLPLWLYVIFKKGTTGDNKYGSDPLKNN